MKKYLLILFLISCLQSKNLIRGDILKSSEIKEEMNNLKDESHENDFEIVDKLTDENLTYRIAEEYSLSEKILDKKINEILEILYKNKKMLIKIQEEIRTKNFKEVIKKSSLDLDIKDFISKSETAKKVKEHIRGKFIAFFIKVFENEIDIPNTILKIKDIIPSYFTKADSSKFSSYLYDQYYDYKKTDDDLKSSLKSFFSEDIKNLIEEELFSIYSTIIVSGSEQWKNLIDSSILTLEIVDKEVFIEGFKVSLKKYNRDL